MILEDLALNIAAGLVQWLIEPPLDDWRRRVHDPQRAAVTAVFADAARQMLRGLSADLQHARPDLGSGDYAALGGVLQDYFALPPVRAALLDAAVTGQPLDMARMATHFRTVRGPERTPGFTVPLARSLTVFCAQLGAGIRTAAQDQGSPLHNFWSVLVADNTQRLARAIEGAVQENQSAIDEIRRLLAQTLTAAPPAYLWVNVPPPPAAPLLGRDLLLTDLVARLTAGHSPALSTDGLPGVGKTALAVALAHDARIRAHFTDGVLWAGLGTQPDVITAQNQWATALGIDLSDEPDVHRRAQRLSGAVGERRVLVVIDDAWDAETPKMLRLSSPHTVHLLTSRDRTIARAFAGAAQQVHVPELEEKPAYALLQRLAPEACAADPAAARALVQTVGELPLAIEVLGGYLAGHDLTVFPDQAPDAFKALADARQRLALAAERLGSHPGKRETLDEAIRLSVEALTQTIPVAAAAFWSLGAFAPKPATFDRAAAAAVTGAAAPTLALLVNRSLVEADGLMAVHQVVHDVMTTETPAEAQQRHARHYAAAMRLADDEQRYHEMLPALPQLRTAFDWAIEHDLELALDIAANSANLQRQFSLIREGADWADRLRADARSNRIAPATLARVQGHRANILSDLATLPGEDRRQRLYDALAAYDDALRFRRPDNAPLDYATTQNNRANILSDLATLPGEDRRQRLYDALAAYDDALRFRRPDNAPLDYAQTQNNRANRLRALATLPGEDRRQRLYDALAAYDDALRFRRPDNTPLDYAQTQNNRALLLSDLATLPGEDRRQRLYDALAAYDDALRFRRPDNAPLDYATTQNNRAILLSALATLPGEDRRQRLYDALAAYDDALRFLRPDNAPLAYAQTQNNRATILSDLATLPGEDRRQRLYDALAAYDDALRFRRPDNAPLAYAQTQNNRAYLLRFIAELPGENSAAHLRTALDPLDAAQQLARSDNAPLDYAMSQDTRANVLLALADTPDEDRPARLRQSLRCSAESIALAAQYQNEPLRQEHLTTFTAIQTACGPDFPTLWQSLNLGDPPA